MKNAITHTVPVTIDMYNCLLCTRILYALPSLDSDGHMEYTYNADHSTALHMYIIFSFIKLFFKLTNYALFSKTGFGAFVQALMTMYIYPTTLTGVLRACVLCKGKRYQTSKIIIYL